MKTSTKTTLLRGVNIVGAMVVLLGVGTVAANADVCRDQPGFAINVNLGGCPPPVVVDRDRDRHEDRFQDHRDGGRRDDGRRDDGRRDRDRR